MRPKLSRSPRSRLSASEISVPGKTFVSYERKETFHIISYQGEISLVNLSKCFLGNRDNFCPYEQALSPPQLLVIMRKRRLKRISQSCESLHTSHDFVPEFSYHNNFGYTLACISFVIFYCYRSILFDTF